MSESESESESNSKPPKIYSIQKLSYYGDNLPPKLSTMKTNATEILESLRSIKGQRHANIVNLLVSLSHTIREYERMITLNYEATSSSQPPQIVSMILVETIAASHSVAQAAQEYIGKLGVELESYHPELYPNLGGDCKTLASKIKKDLI